jgi:hypothetical protein
MAGSKNTSPHCENGVLAVPPRQNSCRQPAKVMVVNQFRHNALAETINGLYKAELTHRRAP